MKHTAEPITVENNRERKKNPAFNVSTIPKTRANSIHTVCAFSDVYNDNK